MESVYEEKVRKARVALASAEHELATQEALTPEQRLAEEIHTLMCHSNHADGCGWFYNSWTNFRASDTYNARSMYFRKANRLLRICNGSLDLASQVITVLREV